MMTLAAGLSASSVYNENGWRFSASQDLTSYGHPSPAIILDHCELSFASFEHQLYHPCKDLSTCNSGFTH